jgi:hypothetical protein
MSTFKSAEKRKRFKLERDITDRLQKESVCLLQKEERRYTTCVYVMYV